MKNLKKLIREEPYKYNFKSKKKFFLPYISNLINFHAKKSKKYKKILDHYNIKDYNFDSLDSIPYIPVRLFKLIDLMSIHKDDVYRTLISSGTSGSDYSKIYLDKNNSKVQIEILNKLTSNIIGKKRLPMLIIDQESSNNNISKFSARVAAIRGFSVFSNEKCFALDDKMQLNQNLVMKFLDKYKNKKIMIFGFTSIIWENFLIFLIDKKIKLDLSDAFIIHGGGWKKLINKNIDNDLFKKQIKKYLNIKYIINYYGMVEQTGSIFYECQAGFFHTSNFNDIIIRNQNFKICDIKEKGIIQLLSLLPTSYPGNSILTEDIGSIYGLDDCHCGKKGKYFKVFGRIKSAELRGCSDVV
jgi:hypothetical protein|tara:strand:+ start:1999 stop:3066 length:1068 start_codon:yes stop_codon:yes gene_type:complete